LKALNSILTNVHYSWVEILTDAFCALDDGYLNFLLEDKTFFPDIDNFLNPFKTLPLHDVKYILFGQDPYPRKESAIGYAFIDARVKNIFSSKGLSKEVNKATSLRNFIKMLLLCEGLLNEDDLSQNAITKINKRDLCDSAMELKDNFEKNGVLLLNMALVFTKKNESKYHLKAWKPFVQSLLCSVKEYNIKLILFGNVARDIEKLECSKVFDKLFFVHPYNVSFINDRKVHRLFGPMNLIYNYS